VTTRFGRVAKRATTFGPVVHQQRMVEVTSIPANEMHLMPFIQDLVKQSDHLNVTAYIRGILKCKRDGAAHLGVCDFHRITSL
jgi:hypothetical protein